MSSNACAQLATASQAVALATTGLRAPGGAVLHERIIKFGSAGIAENYAIRISQAMDGCRQVVLGARTYTITGSSNSSCQVFNKSVTCSGHPGAPVSTLWYLDSQANVSGKYIVVYTTDYVVEITESGATQADSAYPDVANVGYFATQKLLRHRS